MSEEREHRMVPGLVVYVLLAVIAISIFIWIVYELQANPCGPIAGLLYFVPGLTQSIGAIYGAMPC